MELLDLYRAIITSVGWEINSNNQISAFKGPVEIAGHNLVLPTNDILRNPEWDTQMAFHPMSENVLRGESMVLLELRKQMQFRLNFIAATLIQGLSELAADDERSKGLTIKQKDLLKMLPDFDAKTMKSINSLLDRVNPNQAEKIIGLFPKRSGELKNAKGKVEQFKRLAVIHSPMRQEEKNKDRSIFGAKFRKVDFAAFFKLSDYIMPGINDHAYSFGSNSMVAPSFHALLNAYVKMAKQLNTITRAFQRVWGEDFDEMLIDVSWEGDIKDLEKYKGIIPTLRGNEGGTNPDEPQELEEAPKSTTAPKATVKKKLDWTDKGKAAAQEGAKRTLNEARMGQQAPQVAPVAKPTVGIAKVSNTYAAEPVAAPAKVRVQDLRNNAVPMQQPMVARNATPYGQQPAMAPGWGPQPAQPAMQAAPSWGAPQQAQPVRQATAYGNQQPVGWGTQPARSW